MVLAIRTDKPAAELYLLSAGGKQAAKDIWPAGNQLSKQILSHIKQLLNEKNQSLAGLDGIIVFAGPGSFTGLRIGISVANGLAYGLSIPIVGTKGNQWIKNGLREFPKAKTDRFVIPEYGARPNISRPKK
ncbi:tRNA (adenosine(37)-N6)-threonylcarbamoyltransferase complex dimerization subunit type 1 TsaB [Candidatus Microgenomates bacterium]|nr:tRNA (adenosine(37)-N6)-threonylcarbamoyltransferase complex dimerization subunit type 1 TsaB [Candidatus Microgenomates bacterium]